MLIYLEWRDWMITLKIPIQNEMLIFLGPIVSINYAYKGITCTEAPEIDSQPMKFLMNCYTCV